jgi:hypothetical protein
MAVESYNPKFKLASHYGDDHYIQHLENGLVSFTEWGLLKIGAWQEVPLSTSGIGGGDFSRLRLGDAPGYSAGQVWEGVRKQWVYETGVNHIDGTGGTQNPLPVGTPTINGVAATGAYHVDYPNGRIIFDTAISSSATVKVAHSFKNVQIYKADECPWYNEIQYRSQSPESTHFQQQGSGNWSVGPNHRIQMPTIVIGAIARGNTAPFEIGNGKLWGYQDVMFHVFAENRADRNKLASILMAQTELNIWLYDSNIVSASGAFPLDYRGEFVGSNMYPDIVSETNYRYRRAKFRSGVLLGVESRHPNLHEGLVKMTMELDL